MEYQDLSGLHGELTRKAWAWTQIPSVFTSACFSVGSPDSRPHKHEYKYINIFIYKYDFCNTIKRQCTTINSPLRKDIVHRLLEPLKYRQDNYFDEQQEFISNHAKNIYKFAQSLDWDALSKK